MKYFSDLGSINVEFAAYLEEGWYPAGSDFIQDGLIVLFILNEAQNPRAWRMQNLGLHSSAKLKMTAQAQFNNALDENYIPFGISLRQNELWLGLLRPEQKSTYQQFKLEGYENDGEAFIEGINQHITEGYEINGFQFVNNTIFISYIR